MRPFHRCAIPHQDILDGKSKMSEYAAKLGEVHKKDNKTSDDYLDSKKFFQRTFLTSSFEQIIQDVQGRLNGEDKDHFLNIRTPFGGGKTHTLIGLLHKANEWNAKTVVLDGRKLDVNKQTLWGEIELQLEGKIKKLDGLNSHGSTELKNILEKHEPLLILIDEPMFFVDQARGIKVGDTNLAEGTVNFFTELSTAVTEMKKTCVVFSLPQSENEYGDSEDSVKLYSRLKKITGRVEANITPITSEEIPNVVRRRLFNSTDDEIKDNAEEIITKFVNYCDDNNLLPEGMTSTQFRKKFENSYPFLPHVIDELYERWGSIQNFQRTRGVLRLLSMVVQDLINRYGDSAPPFISFADFNLENPGINGELVKLTDTRYSGIISSDITGENSAAKRVDKEMGPYAASKLAEKSMTTIFMYSHSADASVKDGAIITDIKRAVCKEDIYPSTIDEILQRGKEKLAYLHQQNDRFLFKVKGNISKLKNEFVEGLKPEEIEEEKIRLIKENLKNSQFDTYVISSKEDIKTIKDNTEQKLIIIDKDPDMMQEIIENHGQSPRINRNTITFVCTVDNELFSFEKNLKDKIAYEKMINESKIDKDQKEEVKKLIHRCSSDLPYNLIKSYNSIWGAFSKEGTVEMLKFTAVTDIESISKNVLEQLLDNQIMRTGDLGPKELKRNFLNEDFVDTKKIYDTMCRTPGQQRVTNIEILKECVRKGVFSGDFGFGKLIDGKPVYDFWKENCPVSIEEGEIIINPEKIPPTSKELPQEGVSGETEVSGGETEGGVIGGETVKPVITTKDSLEINTNLPDGKSIYLSELFPKINNSFKDIQIHIECKNGEISEEKIDEIKRILNSLGAKFDVN
tara:strand:+ start:80 stop:2644 length:2565 start_codon:yes stop_codon:yes gene_type:complete